MIWPNPNPDCEAVGDVVRGALVRGWVTTEEMVANDLRAVRERQLEEVARAAHA